MRPDGLGSRRWLAAVGMAVTCLVGVTLAGRQAGSPLEVQARQALAQIEGDLVVSGLEQPVEVIRDRWGVPHIYATTADDLFFAQGYVAAQDRLWQLDVWRRIADGKLSELLGPSAVTRDTFARLLAFRGDLDMELSGYAPESAAIIDSFVQGINARIRQVLEDPSRLPIEFQLTGSRPEPWTVRTVIGRMAGYIMTRNLRTEVQRARLARAAGEERVPMLMPTDPPTVPMMPFGLDLDDITDQILAISAGAGESADFSPLARTSAPADRDGFFTRPPPPWPTETSPFAMADPASGLDEVGSNDWVVAGRHTASGKPLLANDPHRTLMLPSLRYTVHLVGPGWNVIGAGEPALPGVAAGHNDRVAFGFTIVGMDQQDLYVERLDPQDHGRYLYRGASEPMRVAETTIQVRGEAPRVVKLRYTRHGPVLHLDETRLRAYALRWVGEEPGAAGYLRSLSLDTARDWQEFLKAVDGWKVPSENIIYADVDGNIGWIAAGLAPVRPNWDGLYPVPGHEGRFEWSGYLPSASLPQLYNPLSGIIATANHDILPPTGGATIGYEFGAPHRFTRIIDVLTSRPTPARFTVADFERLQHDEQSVVARGIASALAAALGGTKGQAAAAPVDDVQRAARLIAGWDGTLAKDSPAAALYELWLPKLSTAMAEAILSPSDRKHLGDRMSTEKLLALLEVCELLQRSPLVTAWVDGSPRPAYEAATRGLLPPCSPNLGARVKATLRGPALDTAWKEAVQQMGPDPTQWAWGRLHRASFEHPLAWTAERKAVMNLGDVPRGGDGTTPNATGAGARQTSGASFREVLDPSNWDQSTTINVPGASGQPVSRHYGDLLPLWAEGRYHPLPFSREAVEKYAAARLKLLPR